MEIHHAEPRDHAAITELVRSSRLPLDLTRAALDLASARGLRRIYLLIETAGGCFPRVRVSPHHARRGPRPGQGVGGVPNGVSGERGGDDAGDVSSRSFLPSASLRSRKSSNSCPVDSVIAGGSVVIRASRSSSRAVS
jgi:hypothetical protein